MNSNNSVFFEDILAVKYVDTRQMSEGRFIVIFKFSTNDTRKNKRLKEIINSLSGTMGGDNIYFGNAYGNDIYDFFFNIEKKKNNLIDELKYIRTILNRAVQLAENNSALVSFTIEVDECVKFATFNYLSYLPQYLKNLDIPVSFQSSIVDELIHISILQLSSCTNSELETSLGAFLLLPTIDNLQLKDCSQEVIELIEQVSIYKSKLNQLAPNATIIDHKETRTVEEQPIALFGGYIKIPAINIYGIEVNVPKIIRKLNCRKNQNHI
ncbi:hypothetical protein I6L41_10355 [Aeromonas sp. FDAARGOS 1411]|uniref:hypothetical protein n=1 Tax=Aeromonas TaxID=642 RepID=UPI001C21E441|nr:hypothetical protein [Aeromonas sp. FDAARGOS 1411]QWZ92850.1 hypothetical protein I6L41_10355 [Aeromonas sp. FDAARGOS 1411]